MIISHEGKAPQIDPSAVVTPTATICGDVTMGPNCRIMHGAAVIAEGGSITIGEQCIVFENAVIRSNQNHSAEIGNYCLIGPNAHVVGCTLEDSVFIASGAAVFHGARACEGSQVRINGVLHIKSRLEANAVVPIGWVAVGDPARIFSPDKHDQIWAIQKPLNFPLTVYGYDRGVASMQKITGRLAENLASHRDDSILSD
ncbi:MAG: gamma carbonic anhydrase family protein [Deltaproteobacteria bacterium]|jgi:carbonic anhydrase/acetyltransferase-like protein (isoleucine patch superfamily)|nr:gamma carbonic anhydrase family protein [Deltaproteobacteria bacterium]